MTLPCMFTRLAGLGAALLVSQASAAAEAQGCDARVLATLGRALGVAHFVPRSDDDTGVIVATSCKRAPDDPRLTLAAVAWDAGASDTKALAVAMVDEAATSVVALAKDELAEDGALTLENGSLRLDTAPYLLAPGVRAFGLDVFHADASCGDGGQGPTRTLYVRAGRTLRPVLADFALSEFRYVRGTSARCALHAGRDEAAITEDFTASIALGEAGKGGWRDLVVTGTARRSDHEPTRKPLHVVLHYDGQAYRQDAFEKAWWHWRE